MMHCEYDLSHEQTLKERKENLSPSADGLAISFYTFLFDWLVGNWLVCWLVDWLVDFFMNWPCKSFIERERKSAK